MRISWQWGDPETASGVLRVDKDPESLTQFVHRCKERGIQAAALWEQVAKAREETVRYGLLLALGEFGSEEIPTEDRTVWVETLAEWYRTDPKSSIHGACGWLLRQWGETKRVEAVDRTPVSYDPQREWFVKEIRYGDDANAKRDYFTFIVVPPGKFQMGSPDHEADRSGDERRHEVELSYTFALCDREITNAQYSRFLPAEEASLAEPAMADHPVVNVSWNEAVQYCQRLTGRTPELKPCYLPVREEMNPGAEAEFAAPGAASLELVEDWPSCDGIRLPTEAEWEYACRAGTITRFSCGSDDFLLRNYARFATDGSGEDSTVRCRERSPNLRGLFDMHGNVWEWCSDAADFGDLGLETDTYLDGVVDPLCRLGRFRVHRGGSWLGDGGRCRSAYRISGGPGYRNDILGFRVCLALSPAGAEP